MNLGLTLYMVGFISTCWLDSLCQTSHLHCMLWCAHQSKTSNQPAHHVGFRGLSGTCLPSSGSLLQGKITIKNLWAHECWSRMFGPGVEYNFRLWVKLLLGFITAQFGNFFMKCIHPALYPQQVVDDLWDVLVGLMIDVDAEGVSSVIHLVQIPFASSREICSCGISPEVFSHITMLR